MNHSNTDRYLRLAAFSSVLLAVASLPVAADNRAAPVGVSTGASLLGGALPGGAVISARSVSVAPVAGGQAVSALIASAGTFKTDTQAAKQDVNGGMPNRISMNVTVGGQTRPAELDGAPIEVDVGADGTLSGRVAAQ
jgi:hypothetical protein